VATIRRFGRSLGRLRLFTYGVTLALLLALFVLVPFAAFADPCPNRSGPCYANWAIDALWIVPVFVVALVASIALLLRSDARRMAETRRRMSS